MRNNLGNGKSSLEIGDDIKFTANGGTAIQCSKAQSNKPELIISGIEADAVEYLGTYAVSGADFELQVPDDQSPTLGKFTNVTLVKEQRNSFVVDVIKIPEEHFGSTVSGISFVKLKGVATPVFNDTTESVNSFNKNLGVNAESDFEAEEVLK